MTILKIKNFGPIGDNRDIGENSGFFTVQFLPVTVFIGPQGSGKSTVAKLFSTFTWLEKALVRGDVSDDKISNTRVFKNLCVRQEISEYFCNDTNLIYEGDVYTFEYSEKEQLFKATLKTDILKSYISPKIQYISAARNLLTILYKVPSSSLVDREGNTIEILSNIPFMVNNLNKEYIHALKKLAKDGFHLPVRQTRVFHENHNTFIKTGDKKISMSAASSGIQSITPLLIVSEFLSIEVRKELFEKLQVISANLKRRIEKELSKINNENMLEQFNLYCMGGKEILNANDDILQLEKFLKTFIPSCFINIVEEPEQNLFPETQAKVLYELLKCRDTAEHNKLVISTHSPYILTALNNAILANDVFKKSGKSIDELPKNRMVSFENVSAFKFENSGIISITDDETRLIDASQIDGCSTDINEAFDKLKDLNDE